MKKFLSTLLVLGTLCCILAVAASAEELADMPEIIAEEALASSEAGIVAQADLTDEEKAYITELTKPLVVYAKYVEPYGIMFYLEDLFVPIKAILGAPLLFLLGPFIVLAPAAWLVRWGLAIWVFVTEGWNQCRWWDSNAYKAYETYLGPVNEKYGGVFGSYDPVPPNYTKLYVDELLEDYVAEALIACKKAVEVIYQEKKAKEIIAEAENA